MHMIFDRLVKLKNVPNRHENSPLLLFPWVLRHVIRPQVDVAIASAPLDHLLGQGRFF